MAEILVERADEQTLPETAETTAEVLKSLEKMVGIGGLRRVADRLSMHSAPPSVRRTLALDDSIPAGFSGFQAS